MKRDNLYLSDKEGGGEFTQDDEETLGMFVAHAAMAIANARRHREEQRARADLETLIDTSPVGVVVFNAGTGVPVSLNREGRRLVDGLRNPDQTTEQLLDVLAFRRADGREISLREFSLAEALSTGETVRAEEIVISVADGRSVTVLLNATPIRSKEGQIESVVVTLQDMTALEELDRLRAEFLGMVSHELRAPLTSIKGSASTVLGSSADMDPAVVRQFFRILDEQADHMHDLVADLLDVARIETGTLPVTPEPAEVAVLVDRARSTFISAGGQLALPWQDSSGQARAPRDDVGFTRSDCALTEKRGRLMTTLADVQALISDNGVWRVDLLVTDLVGRWHHLSIPAGEVDDSLVERGHGFDGSSLRGFQSVEESDMLLRPDLSSARIDPTEPEPTLKLICDVYDPITGERYSRDPRYVAAKSESHLAASGIADKAFFGPEIEFFVFDNVQFNLKTNSSFHVVDSNEADWGLDRDGSNDPTGYLIPPNQGYTPVSPFDKLSGLRWEMAEKMEKVGIGFETHHHEVAAGGQSELATRFNTLLQKADESQWYKHIVRNVANDHGKFATFMPKPVFDENGTGMHVHQSLWLDGCPLFYDEDGYAQLSELARYYIGGLLAHGPSLLAFCAPSTNSYKRLVPGFESPIYLTYSQRNRSAAVRIPTYEITPASKRVEFRPPDPSANTYLALPAMLMAGLDGIKNKIDPGDPVEENIYELGPEEAGSIKAVPSSMEEAVAALGIDHEYLLQGDVFTQDVIDHYIALKEQEARNVFLHPVPAEFVYYFHI